MQNKKIRDLLNISSVCKLTAKNIQHPKSNFRDAGQNVTFFNYS